MFAAARLPKPHRNHRCARVPGISFGNRDTISVRHCSVLLSHLFLRHLDAEISENRGFLTVSRGEEGRQQLIRKMTRNVVKSS